MTAFDAVIRLSYCNSRGEQSEEFYPVHYESPVNEQFFSEEALYEAICAFFYAFEVKNMLKKLNLTHEKSKKDYIEPLKKMK